MDDRYEARDELDDLISRALADEPLAFVFAVSLVVAAVAIWFTNLSFLYTEGVSGGKGHLDYYFTALTMYFSGYQGTYTLLMSFILAIGAFIVALAMQVHKFIFTD